MIYLVHGEDVVSSKNFLLKMRTDYTSLDQISFKGVKNIDELLPTGKGLFSERKLVIIENFPLRKGFELAKNLDFDVVLWFPETVITPTWINKVWYFKQRETNSSFRLADAVAYGQERQALLVLKELLRDPREKEMIVGSLVRQMRLIALSLSGEGQEVSKSQFLQEKVQEQARSWNFRKIRSALVYLLKTDLWLKQGKLSVETLLTNLTIDLCRISKAS